MLFEAKRISLKSTESSNNGHYSNSTIILDTDVVEDGRDSPEAIIGVHVSNFMRLN